LFLESFNVLELFEGKKMLFPNEDKASVAIYHGL